MDDSVVVLGLSFDFHDAAAALVVDGQVVAAAEEERFTRVKHDPSLPMRATAACFEAAGIGADEVGHVVFYEKPLLAAARHLAVRRREGPRGARTFVRDAGKMYGRNLFVGARVSRMLRTLGAESPPPLQCLQHHLSHAASAFLPSPFEEAAVLTVDGIGEWATATISNGVRHRIEAVEELRYPDSLGLMYSFVTAYCGFRPNDDEYKVMGLAPYGTPRFADALRELVDVKDDGSFAVNGKAVAWFSPRGLHSKAARRRFDGPPRDPVDPVGQREADLAASVQALTEDVMLGLARRAHRVTGSPNLCLAGGVALNCVANGRLLREGPFESIWVQPAAGDSGGAIGAALGFHHLVLGHERDIDAGDRLLGGALGPAVDADEAAASLRSQGIEYVEIDDPDELARIVARRIADGAVVGWVNGRMEFGPRALGHRSLLADPRDADVRQRLNRLVKGREDFRPFAPAVLEDRAADWFDLDAPSPYMLVVAQVRDEHRLPVDDEPEALTDRALVPRSQIPACTHVDGSARIQTVNDADHPAFHRLISAFEDLTGCPMLLNTSFNRAGEPIVATFDEALATASAGGIDLLVVEHLLVEVAGSAP